MHSGNARENRILEVLAMEAAEEEVPLASDTAEESRPAPIQGYVDLVMDLSKFSRSVETNRAYDKYGDLFLFIHIY